MPKGKERGEVRATEGGISDLDMDESAKQEHKSLQKERHFWVEAIQLKDDLDKMCYVGVNGVSYRFPKGLRCPLPASVVEVLEHALVEYTITRINEKNERVTENVKYNTYPFSVFGEATPTEVTEWKQEHGVVNT